MPPEERDAVKDWILTPANKKWIESRLGVNPADCKPQTVKPSQWGAYIAYAPANIVKPYCNGDVVRTEKLFAKLWKSCSTRGMLEAYERERRLLPHLLRSEREGQRVDMQRLGDDINAYKAVRDRIDERIRKKCKKKDLNVDSNSELAEAMVDAGLADDGLMGYTKTGKIQTNKQAIADGVTDKEMKGLLAYRAPLSTCLSTFMQPWLRTAQMSDGLLYTNWNQVKQGDGKNRVGTSTGRLSSTPNFQNIPKEFKPTQELMGLTNAQLRQVLASLKLKQLPDLPQCRGYIIPYNPGECLIDRDYSQQELRILGHYEDGVLKQAYLDDTWLDMHEYARQLIKKITGILYDRKPIKNTNFGIIYGQGAMSLAERNNVSIDESKEIIASILEAFPGIAEMQEDMKERAANDEPIRTWGGREYYCEEPQYNEKYRRVMTFDYKLLNLLIQGSAADCSKESIIRWCDEKHSEVRFMMTVHDQTVGSSPAKLMREQMEVMRRTMESVEFDIPILTEGEVSYDNWNALVEYDKAGKITYKGK